MNVVYLKTALSVVELLVGLICIGVSLYFLVEFQNCNPNADFCKPLSILPVLLLLFPGIVILAAGIVSNLIRRIPFWKVQVAMMTIISLYYILFMTLISVSEN